MNGRRLSIAAAVLGGVFLAASIAPALAQPPIEWVSGCLVQSIAPLRLSELAQAIARCEQVIGDAASSRDLRGQAFAQRGLLYAKRWSIVETEQDAVQGITDITEGLRLHNPEKAKKQHFLNIRGQLYLATGQRKKAADDFKAILAEAPDNETARAGLKKTGTPENY
jgi:tetratricopeptide (TPR) repeat protein